MDYLGKIIIAFETQSLPEIRECFQNGVDPNQLHKGQPLIYELINMYSRGPLFRECIKAFVDHGLQFEDRELLAVLLNDAQTLDHLLTTDKAALAREFTFECAFTPLYKASLLHICAEYNHLACAEILVKHGADINAKAGIDEMGFGGQTPIFHTVNQHNNGSLDMMTYLVTLGVDLDLTLTGLIWGKGYDWETFIPSVNPITYSMMGLLRQFQRTEEQIYLIVSYLMKARYGIDYTPPNIPNKYLNT